MNEPRSDESEFVSLRLVARRVWRRRYWLLLSVALFSAIFAAAAFWMRPVYRATTVLAPGGPDGLGIGGSLGGSSSLGGLAQLAGLSLGSVGSTTEESLAVLQSRLLTEKFLQDKSLLPVLFESRWDEKQKKWNVPLSQQPTLALAFKQFDRKVRSISNDRRTGLIRLSIEWQDAKQAAEWANELVRSANEEMRSRAMQEAEASVRHLERELGSTATIETRQAIGRLLEAQINRKMMAAVTGEYAFRVVETAMPPDSRDFIRPRRIVMMILGPIIGLVLSLCVIFFVDGFLARKENGSISN